MADLTNSSGNFDPAKSSSFASPDDSPQNRSSQHGSSQQGIPRDSSASDGASDTQVPGKVPLQIPEQPRTVSAKRKPAISRPRKPAEDNDESWLDSDTADDGDVIEDTDDGGYLLEMDGVSEAPRSLKSAVDDSLDATTLYLNEIGFIPLLTAEQEVKLARETVLGSRDSKRRMIESNLRLVVAIAKRFQNRGLCLLDMIEEGNIGLMRAVEKYNPELGYRFSTYATWWIKQAIDRALMNHSQTIRFPIHVMKDIQHCVRCADQLRELLGREPSMNEIAELSARPVEQVKKLMALHIKMCSADQAVADDSEATLVDQIPCQPESHPDQIVEEQNLQENMAHWVSKLSKRHREVVVRRFGLNGFQDGTLEDVGKDVGITRERVRQLQIEALMKLRRMMERDGFSPDQLDD